MQLAEHVQVQLQRGRDPETNSTTSSTALRMVALSLSFASYIAAPAFAEPVKLIFDTDITGDVDDVLALATIHSLADRGECELLAVTVSKSNPLTGRMVHAINTFYGRPDIPIGITTLDRPRESKYLKVIEQTNNGVLRYPHEVMSNDDLPAAVPLLRKTLASQSDGSVVIVSVGIAGNMDGLIHSQPDDISTLDGKALIQKKVHSLEIMAGSFTPINGNTRFHEANVRNDIPAMQGVANDWPKEVPVVWSGFEIGIAAPYPRESIANDFGYLEHHIVREAYLLHSGPNHDRPNWDLTSVLHAVRPNGYFDLSEPGQVSIADDSYTSFEATPHGRDRYLIMSEKQAVRVQEALRQLVSQPPR